MTERIEVKVGEYGWIEDTPTYTDIVRTFGEVVAETEWGGYQGDTLWMVKGKQGYGIVTFGWGSCSGCDSLEACSSQADIDSLQDDLERGLRWFPTLGEAVAFVEGGGFKDSYLDEEMISAFVKAATTVTVAEGEPQKAVESVARKATFVKDVTVQNGATGEQRLYRLDPPMDGFEFVVTSAINHSWAHETYVFAADEDGEIVDWGELEGSYRGGTDHERALRGAGYEVSA